MEDNNLTKEELRRYSRHLVLPEVGIEGQKKLKQAKVLVIGAGGLGSPSLIYLAAAGVGTIGIADFDRVDETNLQRQILYKEDDIGKQKTAIAKTHLEKINSNIKIITHDEKLASKNAFEIIKDYNVVIDGSDNLPTRYLINDTCVSLNKPFVFGAVFRFDGQASVFNYNNGPCYRCIFPNPPAKDLIQNCADAGVLGVLPGIIGTIQAAEAIKIILEKEKILSERYLVFNALEMTFKELKLRKNKNCIVCGENKTTKQLSDYEQFRNIRAQNENISNEEITVEELKIMMDGNEDFLLFDTREKIEQDMCKIENARLLSFTAIIKGNMKDFENIDKNKKIVLYCHTGNRSGYVLNILKKKGYKNAKNLIGGIDAWAKRIDQSTAIY